MDDTVNYLDDWAVTLLIALAMAAFWGFGYWQGRRQRLDPAQSQGIKFTDASMALLGLLLAFTFAMTLGRHDNRRLTIVTQSNAIGDFYTCATLLKEPHRSALQSVIREYAVKELESLNRYMSNAQRREAALRNAELHGQMTAIVAQAVSDGTPIAICLTETLNALTSAQASRLAAYEEVMPWSIKLLLLVGAVVPSFLMGRQQGSAHEPCFRGTVSFIILVSMVIFVTLDLDQPTRGLITVNRAPLDRLIQSMTP